MSIFSQVIVDRRGGVVSFRRDESKSSSAYEAWGMVIIKVDFAFRTYLGQLLSMRGNDCRWSTYLRLDNEHLLYDGSNRLADPSVLLMQPEMLHRHAQTQLLKCLVDRSMA